jgi:hypothetical protein
MVGEAVEDLADDVERAVVVGLYPGSAIMPVLVAEPVAVRR